MATETKTIKPEYESLLAKDKVFREINFSYHVVYRVLQY
jgi:hypothetical protein